MTRRAAFWPITPTPWVRESNRDRWKPRPGVLRYRAFRDECAIRKIWKPYAGDLVVFLMPIPKSWSQKKKRELDRTPHLQVPDVDNLTKALLDATYEDDAAVWMIEPVKIWSSTPGIYIERREPCVEIPFNLEARLAGSQRLAIG